MSKAREVLIQKLISTGGLKFGDFTLKSGAKSEYYVDLRELTLFPELFQAAVASIDDALKDLLEERPTAIVGVPYGVVPVAAAVAYKNNLAYYPVRKEQKEYGNKIKPKLSDSHRLIIIEDVMSTGSSIIETIDKLEGTKVTDVIVIVDRESGGEANIRRKWPHVKLHSIFKSSELINYHKSKSEMKE